MCTPDPLSDDLSKSLPANTQKVGVVAKRVLVFRLAREDETVRYLYLAPGAPFRAIAVSPLSPQRAYPHAEWLGPHIHHIEGGELVAIAKLEDEDVLELGFKDGLTCAVHFFGVAGNAVLVGTDGKVLAAWHPGKRYRAGEKYALPAAEHPTASRIQTVSAEDLLTQVGEVELEDVRAEVKQYLRRERRRLEKRLAKLEQEAREAARADEYKKWGELLKANYHLLQRGMSLVTVTDYFSPGLEEVAIPLEPGKTPQENVSRYFRKAKKLARAPEQLAARRRVTEQELGSIDEKCRLQSTLFDVCELQGLLPPKRAAPARREKHKPASRIRRFVSSDGFTILAGRSAKDNDHLTVHIANGNDLWLHTRGRAGTHVVVRAERNKEFPRQTLIEAAQVCAHLSKAPDGEVEEVTYTFRKHVTKPKGAKPGLVLVASGKTIAVRQNEKAMKRWLREHRDVSTHG